MSKESAAEKNRREHFRQPMFCPIQLRVEGRSETIPGMLVNLSAGGCQVTTTALIDRRKVGFDLSYISISTLPLTGRVRKILHFKSSDVYYYGIEFQFANERIREDLLRFIVEEQVRILREYQDMAKTSDAPKRLREQRVAARVSTNFVATYALSDKPGEHFEGTVLNISTGGLRMITSHMLRREWSLELQIELPSEVLKLMEQSRRGEEPVTGFAPMTVIAQPMPGIRTAQGHFVHSLSFRRPDPETHKELTRFISAAQQARLRPE